VYHLRQNSPKTMYLETLSCCCPRARQACFFGDHRSMLAFWTCLLVGHHSGKFGVATIGPEQSLNRRQWFCRRKRPHGIRHRGVTYPILCAPSGTDRTHRWGESCPSLDDKGWQQLHLLSLQESKAAVWLQAITRMHLARLLLAVHMQQVTACFSSAGPDSVSPAVVSGPQCRLTSRRLLASRHWSACTWPECCTSSKVSVLLQRMARLCIANTHDGSTSYCFVASETLFP
jgi:hypothetical protein